MLPGLKISCPGTTKNRRHRAYRGCCGRRRSGLFQRGIGIARPLVATETGSFHSQHSHIWKTLSFMSTSTRKHPGAHYTLEASNLKVVKTLLQQDQVDTNPGFSTEESGELSTLPFMAKLPLFAPMATHLILTDESVRPIQQRSYRISPKKKVGAAIEEQLQGIIVDKIFRPSRNTCASPVVLIEKEVGSSHYYEDNRDLNNVTKKDAHIRCHALTILSIGFAMWNLSRQCP